MRAERYFSDEEEKQPTEAETEDAPETARWMKVDKRFSSDEEEQDEANDRNTGGVLARKQKEELASLKAAYGSENATHGLKKFHEIAGNSEGGVDETQVQQMLVFARDSMGLKQSEEFVMKVLKLYLIETEMATL